ncbi:MAG TPA: hypothetical protein VEB60_02295 [Candidatus Paceibacterota bacterium]|nr:hypothetical protein [Candidatus Paceibacterota bacterium]
MMFLKVKKQGIAILYAVLLITVIMTIGLLLSDIITKQIILSSTVRSSQEAFSAAISGRECFNYWDQYGVFGTCPDGDMECQAITTIKCGEHDLVLADIQESSPTEIRTVFDISHAEDKVKKIAPMCTRVSVKVNENPSGGYRPDGQLCSGGPNCFRTFVVASGYNSSCAEIGNSPRTLERSIRILDDLVE